MRRLLTLCGLLLLLPCLARSQPKAPENKDLPRLLVAQRLGIPTGKTTRLTLRGLHLDTVTEIQIHEPKSSVKLLKKGKVAVPNQQDAAKVGDSEVEIELTLPEEAPLKTISLSAVAPAGVSPPYHLLVDAKPAQGEIEPNNGFKNAQLVTLPAQIDGAIGQPQDVDVFRFAGKAGQRVVVEVFAARYGSALDSFLTLYSAEGQLLAANDDLGDSTDSRIELTLPKDGSYFISVLDANDQGGPAHVYRLALSAK